MSISSLYLDAFVSVAKAQSFSKASKLLNITQSALSQRIGNLEDDLGLSLFIRTSKGTLLTKQGEKLLRYCQTKDSLEDELLSDLNAQNKRGLSGSVRVGTYSSVFRSVVIPSLTPLLKRFPEVNCELNSVQTEKLQQLLQSSEVDFIVTDKKIDRNNIETEILGREKLVIIEGKKNTDRDSYFLDNNYEDQVTDQFFKKKKIKYRRSFFNDCYGIIDGVEKGLGKAIMPFHLVGTNRNIRILNDYSPQYVNVYLHYHTQAFYSQLHHMIINHLKDHAKNYLIESPSR